MEQAGPSKEDNFQGCIWQKLRKRDLDEEAHEKGGEEERAAMKVGPKDYLIPY